MSEKQKQTRALFGCGGVNLPQVKCFVPTIYPQQFYPIEVFGLWANLPLHIQTRPTYSIEWSVGVVRLQEMAPTAAAATMPKVLTFVFKCPYTTT